MPLKSLQKSVFSFIARLHLPLHQALALLFVPLLLAASVSLVVFWSLESDRLIKAQANETFARMLSVAANQMRALVDPVKVTVIGAAEFPQFGQRAQPEDAPRLRNYWFRVLMGYPQMGSVYATFEDNAFIQIGRIEAVQTASLQAPGNARFFERVVSRTIAVADGVDVPQEQWRFFAEDFSPISESLRPWSGYIASQRPWYIEAAKSKGLIVTAPYVFASTQAIGITVAMASSSNRQVIIGADVSLDKFSNVMNRSLLNGPLSAAIITASGDLAAIANDGTASSDALRRGVVEFVRQKYVGQSPAQVQEYSGYLVSTQPLFSGSGELYLVAATSRANLIGPFAATQQRALLLSMVLMLALSALAVYLAMRIARPLRLLALQATKLQRLDLFESEAITSRVSEVVSLDREIEQAGKSLRGLGRYIPRSLAEHLIAGSITPVVGGIRTEATLLFSDIEDFSLWSESQEPDVLARDMSEYFQCVTKTLRAQDATIDKFIGDSVMAFWNAPNPQADAPQRGFAAAIALQQRLTDLNTSRQARGLKPFHTRVGLHRGEVWVGNIGTSDRLNYTALGEAVNVASRIEGLCKHYGCSILLTDSVVQCLPGEMHRLRFIDTATPRGSSRALNLYEPFSADFTNTDMALWNAAQSARQAGNDALAIEKFAAWLERHPNDLPGKALHKKAQSMVQTSV